jgi:hypothetical protein
MSLVSDIITLNQNDNCLETKACPMTEEISCGAFVWKSDPVSASLFQRHYSSALVLQEQSVNGEYCAKTLKGALQNAIQQKDMNLW